MLLATNQLQFLPYADKVCYLENGRIAAQGAPQALETTPGRLCQWRRRRS